MSDMINFNLLRNCLLHTDIKPDISKNFILPKMLMVFSDCTLQPLLCLLRLFVPSFPLFSGLNVVLSTLPFLVASLLSDLLIGFLHSTLWKSSMAPSAAIALVDETNVLSFALGSLFFPFVLLYLPPFYFQV